MSESSRLLVPTLVALLSILAPAWGGPRPQATVDLVLRGGRVLDGSGNPWVRADVAIDGDRVVAVGELDGLEAREEIDAGGLWVAPGFIDVHSHAAGGLASADRSDARTLLTQGLTTVVVNPDGGGAVDLAEQRQSLLEHGLGVNVAQMVSHGSIRRAVLGMDDRVPRAGELARMEELARAGMAEGAFGLSSGLFYAPGSYADLDEVVALARVVAESEGVYTSHIRDESDYSIGLLAAVEEVIEVARQAGIPGVVTHVKALGPNVWGLSAAVVGRIERARAEGVEVWADQYPYEASSTSLGAALVPRWAQEGGEDALRARLADAGTRARIRAAMVENLARRGGPERIQIAAFGEDPALEGRTLRRVADDGGLDPVDAAMEIVLAGGASIVSFNMDPDDLRRLMEQPWTMTSSDGGIPRWQAGVPHPRSYGAFPRKIRRYVVELGWVSLADAVRSMTGLPAAVFRIEDRGVLRAGAFADVVVFDLDRLADRATYTEPHRLSEGIVHLLVNGELAVRDGEPTGGMAGRVLRRARPARGEAVGAPSSGRPVVRPPAWAPGSPSRRPHGSRP